MICKHCGEVLADGAKFCENCGNKVEEVVVEAENIEETVDNTADNSEDSYKEPERVEAEVVSDDNIYSEGTSQPEASGEEKGPQGYSIASLVCGILGLLCCCCGWIGLIISIAGIVLGIISLNKNCEGKGMAIAGIACGGVGALIALIGVIAAAASGNLVSGLDDLGNMDQISDFLDSL